MINIENTKNKEHLRELVSKLNLHVFAFRLTCNSSLRDGKHIKFSKGEK